MNTYFRFIVLFLTVGLAACSSTPPPRSESTPPAQFKKAPIPVSTGQKIANIAKAQIGRRYCYAGSSPAKGFDCSGLAWYSHKQLGISIPRRSADQFRQARPVKTSNLRAGDLLFYRISSTKVSHVGIYTGNRRFVHAPSSGQHVESNRIDHPYWRQRLVGAGRFTPK